MGQSRGRYPKLGGKVESRMEVWGRVYERRDEDGTDIGAGRERKLARANPLEAMNYRLVWPCPEHKEIGMQYLTGG